MENLEIMTFLNKNCYIIGRKKIKGETMDCIVEIVEDEIFEYGKDCCMVICREEVRAALCLRLSENGRYCVRVRSEMADFGKRDLVYIDALVNYVYVSKRKGLFLRLYEAIRG